MRHERRQGQLQCGLLLRGRLVVGHGRRVPRWLRVPRRLVVGIPARVCAWIFLPECVDVYNTACVPGWLLLPERLVVGEFAVPGGVLLSGQRIVGHTNCLRAGDVLCDEFIVQQRCMCGRLRVRVARFSTNMRQWKLLSCGNNYGGCVFKGICNKDPVVREKFLETDFEKRVWDPMVPR